MNSTYPRLTLGALVTVAGFAAASADVSASTAPPDSTAPVCTSIPDGLTLIINSGDGVGAATSSGYEPIVAGLGAPAVAGVRGPDGTTWVERGGDRPAIMRAGPDVEPTEVHAAADLELGGAGWFGGRSAAVFLDRSGEPEPTSEGVGAVVVDFADGAQVTLSPSQWWEAGVHSASIGADRVVEGGSELVSDWFRSFGADGTEHTDWISPNNDDMQPTHMQPAPAVSPDGAHAELSYLEHGVQDTNGFWTGRHALVVADAVTGAESLRLDIGEDGQWPVRVDFDGRFWVGTFGPMENLETPEPIASRVVVVDTDAPTPTAVDTGCPAGTVASIDKAGSAQPNLSAPTPPTTTPPPSPPPTTVPPSTVPGCDDYVAADNDYPVERCEQGAPVQSVQLMLIHRGYDIEADGDFGPATESAVRQFQASAGVEVDGLVGPDTWAALYDPAHVPGADNDGNGTVDPWELVLDPGPGEGEGWIGRTFPYPQFDTSGEGGSSGTAQVDGVAVWTAWQIGDGAHGLLLIPAADTRTLLLTRSERDPAVDPTTNLTVVDAVDHRLSPDAPVFAVECSVDGVADPTVVAFTSPPSGSPIAVTVASAWRLSPEAGHIEVLDPARVSCSVDGLIVD